MFGTVPEPEGITNPPIDNLLEKVDSKYALAVYAAQSRTAGETGLPFANRSMLGSYNRSSAAAVGISSSQPSTPGTRAINSHVAGLVSSILVRWRPIAALRSQSP